MSDCSQILEPDWEMIFNVKIILFQISTMCPTVTLYSTRLGEIKWEGKEVLVLAEEKGLKEVMDKLKQLRQDFSILDILVLNLGSNLEIRQRLKSNGCRSYTVDTRRTSWSTMQEAGEEVLMNKWRLGSSTIHDELGLEVMKMLEEGQELLDFQVNAYL